MAAMQGALTDAVRNQILARLTWEHECLSDVPGANGEGSDPQLTKWYTSHTLAQLRFLWKVVECYEDGTRKCLEMIFSDVLYYCASAGGTLTSSGQIRRHHWGWIADNVRPKKPLEHNAIEAFRQRLIAFGGLIDASYTEVSPPILIQGDARNLPLTDNSVDLIVTSPPYVGVIDYTHANRLLYCWMGWSLIKDRSDEIGARSKRFRLGAVNEYLTDMRQCWNELARTLKPGGHCAIVIGESRKFPGTVDQTLAHLGELMAQVWGPIARTPTRRRVSDRGASDAVEYVCVYRKT